MSGYETAKKIFRKIGLTNFIKKELRKMDIIPPPSPSFESILSNLKKRGISANTIIDIGASDGRWSKGILEVFPESRFFLIEANEIHKNGLESFKKENKNIEYVLAAAGDKMGQIYFDNTDPFGGLAMYEKPKENFIQVPVVTIDHCVSEYKLDGPFLLKLDTHGFEIPILNGAFKTWEDINIIVVEAYNFKIAEPCLLFYEMCEYMKNNRFRCSGLIDVSHRSKDNFLWQMDLIFVRDTREEFNDNNYI